MKQELQTYLRSKKSESGKSTNTGKITPYVSSEKETRNDRLNRRIMTPALIAPLAESSYVPPELNPHVIHDDHPVKK